MMENTDDTCQLKITANDFKEAQKILNYPAKNVNAMTLFAYSGDSVDDCFARAFELKEDKPESFKKSGNTIFSDDESKEAVQEGNDKSEEDLDKIPQNLHEQLTNDLLADDVEIDQTRLQKRTGSNSTFESSDMMMEQQYETFESLFASLTQEEQ